MAAEDFLASQLRKIRFQFFPDHPKLFFQQQSMITKAVCYPATWLQNRGVSLPEKRLEQILNEILRGIMHHGNTRGITFFGGYLLKCVQDHMTHKGDDYYDEGKNLRTLLDRSVADLTSKQIRDLPAAQDDTASRLAQAAALLKSTRPVRRRSVRVKNDQLDLL